MKYPPINQFIILAILQLRQLKNAQLAVKKLIAEFMEVSEILTGIVEIVMETKENVNPEWGKEKLEDAIDLLQNYFHDLAFQGATQERWGAANDSQEKADLIYDVIKLLELMKMEDTPIAKPISAARKKCKPCPFCGDIPFIDLGKQGSCQLHGETFQAVIAHCKKHECHAKPRVQAGDIYNGASNAIAALRQFKITHSVTHRLIAFTVRSNTHV